MSTGEISLCRMQFCMDAGSITSVVNVWNCYERSEYWFIEFVFSTGFFWDRATWMAVMSGISAAIGTICRWSVRIRTVQFKNSISQAIFVILIIWSWYVGCCYQLDIKCVEKIKLYTKSSSSSSLCTHAYVWCVPNYFFFSYAMIHSNVLRFICKSSAYSHSFRLEGDQKKETTKNAPQKKNVFFFFHETKRYEHC